jgi:phenylacetate-coenzyme A ligase PaaK-like adenylate-forming protein
LLGDSKKCRCDRNFLNISKIKGRDSDILSLPNGKYLIAEIFFHYFCLSRSIGDGNNSHLIEDLIEQFQISQEKVNLIRIRLVVNNIFNDKHKKEIFNYWKKYFGNDIELIVEIVDKIESTPAGKRRFIIRNPDIKIM